MRDNAFLVQQLQTLLQGPFADMPVQNQITIRFGRPAQRRMGSIRMSRDKKRSDIIINGHLKNPLLPERIIQSIIAHELVHYLQGFSSPLPKLHAHPHKGGVVDKELKARGFTQALAYEKKWLKQEWPAYLKLNHSRKRPSIRRSARRPSTLMARMLRRLLIQHLG